MELLRHACTRLLQRCATTTLLTAHTPRLPSARPLAQLCAPHPRAGGVLCRWVLCPLRAVFGIQSVALAVP
jgi:hypothetical protein